MGDEFFFSSRRRHTRWTGDWSSDVCSSDLACRAALPHPPAGPARQAYGLRLGGARAGTPRRRSEERRVGKECRSRWLLSLLLFILLSFLVSSLLRLSRCST